MTEMTEMTQGPIQPDDPTKIRVRVEQYREREFEYDRAQYEQAKADGTLYQLMDADLSDMDGPSVVIEADGTEFDLHY